MSLFAIYGSGFGLYGYLPALISCGQQIILPQRYFSCFYARPELIPFASQVEWVTDENTLLERSTGMVLALKPSLQNDWLPRFLLHKPIEYLLLEKPLAQSPQSAAILFDHLMSCGKIFRIGYTFRYTPWGKQLLAALGQVNNIIQLSIHWCFSAHHFHNNIQTWKRSHAAGGGIIRFYGIHIIALLAEIGYRDVISSQTIGYSIDECEKWRAVFAGDNLPACEIVIDSRAFVNQFQIVQTFCSTERLATYIFTDLSDPFDSVNRLCLSEEGLDRRVSILKQLCQSLWEPGVNQYEWYAATIQLWLIAENKTTFTKEENL